MLRCHILFLINSFVLGTFVGNKESIHADWKCNWNQCMTFFTNETKHFTWLTVGLNLVLEAMRLTRTLWIPHDQLVLPPKATDEIGLILNYIGYWCHGWIITSQPLVETFAMKYFNISELRLQEFINTNQSVC